MLGSSRVCQIPAVFHLFDLICKLMDLQNPKTKRNLPEVADWQWPHVNFLLVPFLTLADFSGASKNEKCRNGKNPSIFHCLCLANSSKMVCYMPIAHHKQNVPGMLSWPFWGKASRFTSTSLQHLGVRQVVFWGSYLNLCPGSLQHSRPAGGFKCQCRIWTNSLPEQVPNTCENLPCL